MSNIPLSQRASALLSSKTLIAGVLAFVAIAALIWGGGGCQATQPKTLSPITNKPATAAEIAVQLEDWKAEQEKAAIKREADLRAELQQAQATAVAEVRRIQEEANATITRAQTLTRVEVDAVAAKANREAEAITQQAAITAQKVQAAQQQAAREIEIDTRAMNVAIDAAEQNLREQAQQREAVFAALQPFAAMVPGGSTVAGLLPLLLGGGVGGLGMLEAARKRRQAAASKEETEAALASASRIVDSIDVLKSADPAVASAFKTHAKLIEEWQGEATTAFVNSLQK